jgi:hypothetical protein
VYIIATPNKDQHLYPKRYQTFSRNMRFANENAGKKDCGFFGQVARIARNHGPKAPWLGR